MLRTRIVESVVLLANDLPHIYRRHKLIVINEKIQFHLIYSTKEEQGFFRCVRVYACGPCYFRLDFFFAYLCLRRNAQIGYLIPNKTTINLIFFSLFFFCFAYLLKALKLIYRTEIDRSNKSL